jgi:hypothetical protein
MTITVDANTAYRDFITDGVPSSGPNKPDKAAIRALFGEVDGAISTVAAAVTVGSVVVKDTQAHLFADLAHAANTLGLVWNDLDVTKDGVYVKVGNSGSGSWSFTTVAVPGALSAHLEQLASSADADATAADASAQHAANSASAAANSAADAAESAAEAADSVGKPGKDGQPGPAPWGTPTQWATATAYHAAAPASAVVYSGLTYVCLFDHTSSASFTADLAAGAWVQVTTQGASGTNVGLATAFTHSRAVSSLRDTVGNFLVGVDAIGRHIASRYANRPVLSTITDGAGKRQICATDHLGVSQLTGTFNGGAGANNYAPELWEGGAIRFTSDRRGVAEPWQMNEDGSGQALVNAGIIYQHWQVYGQSLSVGTNTGAGSTGAVITVGNVTPQALMLQANNGGVAGPRPNLDNTNGPATPDRHTDTTQVLGLVPLQEAVGPAGSQATTCGETVCSGFAAQFCPALDANQRVVLDCSGRGSAAWFQPAGSTSAAVELGPRSLHYANTQSAQALVRKYAEAAASQYLFAGVLMLHGEADSTNLSGSGAPTSYAQYLQDMIQCVTIFNQMARTRSRYHRGKRMYQKQVSSFRADQQPGAFDISRAQADSAVQCASIVCTGGAYDLTYNGDGIHLSAAAERFMGEKFGKWARRVEREGAAPVVFAPYKAILQGAVCTLKFNVPWGLPIVLDTATVAAVTGGNYGVKAYNGDTTALAISGVTLGADSKSLVVTFSAAPSLANNPYVTIADASTMSVATAAGPTQGARSNIRNAETELGALSGLPLYDWACHYKIAMTAS